jgi:hypothetical protein
MQRVDEQQIDAQAQVHPIAVTKHRSGTGRAETHGHGRHQAPAGTGEGEAGRTLDHAAGETGLEERANGAVVAATCVNSRRSAASPTVLRGATGRRTRRPHAFQPAKSLARRSRNFDPSVVSVRGDCQALRHGKPRFAEEAA